MIDKIKVEKGIKLVLEGIGEDIYREGLLETPARIARMYEELMSGMSKNAADVLNKTFTVNNSNIVIERNIFFYSLCEHHMLPFFGNVHIAYIPNGRVVGLSKLARIVEVYARRLQIQEKMVEEIATAIMENVDAKGVMVISEAEHLCMSMRGVRKKDSKTICISNKGIFEADSDYRNEIMQLMMVNS